MCTEVNTIMSFYVNHTEGIDFIGPNPSSLTFTVGQTVENTQRAEIKVLDNFIPQGERNFSLTTESTVGNDGSGGVHVNPDATLVEINIELDTDDCKFVKK